MGRWLVSGILLLCSAGLCWGEEWPVRVLIQEGVLTVDLMGAGPSQLEELERPLVRYLSPGREVRLAWEGKVGTKFRLRTDADLLWVNGRPYRGSIEVWNTSRGLQVINQVALEDYVRGVMAVEADPDWPLQALKAQAVVARTYALYERLASPETLYHLHSTTASQMYRGVSGEDPRSDKAVEATRGVVLAYRGLIIPAFYHAASGGRTEDAVEVWEKKYPFIIGVEDPFSAIAPHHQWQVAIPRSEIRRALERSGWSVGEIRQVEPVRRTRSGRISLLRISHDRGVLQMVGRRLRQLLGPNRIRSTRFASYPHDGKIVFAGQGWGHGVGMSQWGAKGMADLAYDSTGILNHYFPLAELRRLP
ncbi:MAG: SpoIID/LytB domain-containing protein [Candidatus Methylomirabilales bacterium]